MRIAIIKLITILFWMDIHAQSSMDQVLVQIGMNNKTIQATAQYYEAAKIQFKTGNTPGCPVQTGQVLALALLPNSVEQLQKSFDLVFK